MAGVEEVWGYRGWETLAAPKFVVELDQRFISELASVAASFTDLFGEDDRASLVRVSQDGKGMIL